MEEISDFEVTGNIKSLQINYAQERGQVVSDNLFPGGL